MTAEPITRKKVFDPPALLTGRQRDFLWMTFGARAGRLTRILDPLLGSDSLYLHTSQYALEESCDGKCSMLLSVQISADAAAANGTVTFTLTLNVNPELSPC